jgi:hypothetical protein
MIASIFSLLKGLLKEISSRFLMGRSQFDFCGVVIAILGVKIAIAV